jgi:hypothetical protein
MKSLFCIIIFFSKIALYAQNNRLSLIIYTYSADEYFTSASKKDSVFICKNYYIKYKVENKTKDTIYFNTLLYSYQTEAFKNNGDLIYNTFFSPLQLNIDDKGWNKRRYCTERKTLVDAYEKLSDSLLLSFIKKIPPHSSIEDNLKAFCCPDNDMVNEVVFSKDYKIDEKYIKAQLKYNSKRKLYNFPKGAKYWRGKLESNIIYF